jgi:ribosome-associated protein
MSDHDDFEDEGPSKSELKRQVRALQDLGDELVALPLVEFDALDLPDDLREAVATARRITAHGARVRQRLYIGKLLRHIDVEPVRNALARRADVDRQRIHREHAIEQLRALARQARAERDAARPPAAARQLFRRLREALAGGENPGSAGPDATISE